MESSLSSSHESPCGCRIHMQQGPFLPSSNEYHIASKSLEQEMVESGICIHLIRFSKGQPWIIEPYTRTQIRLVIV